MTRRRPLVRRQGTGKRGNRNRATSILIASLLFVSSAPKVDAHAVLVKSTPPARATLSRPATRVDLWFNEPIEPAWSVVSVWNGSGARADRGDALVAPDDPKRLSVTLHGLTDGAYTVRYRVVSVDGHVVESSFTFTVGAKR